MKIFLVGYSVLFFIVIVAVLTIIIKSISVRSNRNVAVFESLNKKWILYLDSLSTIFLLVGILLSSVLSYFGVIELGTGVLVGGIVSFIISIFHMYCFYYLIKCPNCGCSLTKYKNGRRMPMKNAYTALVNESPCRHCNAQLKKQA